MSSNASAGSVVNRPETGCVPAREVAKGAHDVVRFVSFVCCPCFAARISP